MVLKRITFDPVQMDGQPCIRGLRISVATVVRCVASGMSNPEILGAYPDLEEEDIAEALRYAAGLAAAARPVDSLALQEDDDMGASELPTTVSFWKPPSLDELAERQGILPVTDLDELCDLWPEDGDPDEFLTHVLSERAARRRLANDGEGR